MMRRLQCGTKRKLPTSDRRQSFQLPTQLNSLRRPGRDRHSPTHQKGQDRFGRWALFKWGCRLLTLTAEGKIRKIYPIPFQLICRRSTLQVSPRWTSASYKNEVDRRERADVHSAECPKYFLLNLFPYAIIVEGKNERSWCWSPPALLWDVSWKNDFRDHVAGFSVQCRA